MEKKKDALKMTKPAFRTTSSEKKHRGGQIVLMSGGFCHVVSHGVNTGSYGKLVFGSGSRLIVQSRKFNTETS